MVELAICVFYDAVKGKGLLLTVSGQTIHFLRHRLKSYAADITPLPLWIFEVDYHLDRSSYKGKEIASADSIDLPLEVDADAARDVLLDLYHANEEARFKERFASMSVRRF